MPLANLNINVTANTGDSITNLNNFKTASRESMGQSAAAVNAFREEMAASSAVVKAKSAEMGSEMKLASASIEKGSDAAAKALQKIGIASDSVKFKSQITGDLNESQQKIHDFVNETKDYAARTAVIMGAALVTGVSAVVFSAAYAAYKSVDFLTGLVTGESYKSENIDALIAANEKVKDLQKSLQLTAVDANALNDALARLGVDKGDYVAVSEKIASTLKGDTDELDRIGVKYKDVNGQLLSTYAIAQNAKNALDEYTDGWDRNQAAAAIGMGTYEQLSNYLKVNQQEFQNSKSRLDEYTLGIGTEAQAAIEKYQQTMREFNNELKLTGDGFKRAWADQIMPALTTTADFLKDGWPVAVRVFRYSMAQITSLAYGIKTDFDIIYESIAGAMKGIGDIAVGAGVASARAITGDFAGAKKALVQGWNDAGAAIGTAGDNIVAKAKANRDAMALAWGLDNRTQGNGGQPIKGGKPWSPAPALDEEEMAAFSQQLKGYEDAYLRYSNQFESNRAAAVKEANERLQALNQADYDKGIVDLKTYLNEKHLLNVAALRAEITARQAAVKAAQDAFKEADAADKVDGGDIGTQTARLNALNDVLKAKGELEKATNVLTLAEIKNGEESRKSLKDQSAKYREIAASALGLSHDYVAAELAKQEAEKRTEEYLRLETEARKGNADAVEALATKQKQWAYDVAVAQGQVNTEMMNYASTLAAAKDEIDKLYGKSAEAIESERKLREGLSAQNDLQSKLNIAQAAGRAADIAYYSQKIQMQDIVNQRLRDEIGLLDRRRVLTGEVVGFNNGVAIERDAYQRQLDATGYITDSALVNNTTNQTRSNSTQVNIGNINVQGGANANATGQNIAAEIRNNVQAYQFQMLTPSSFAI